MHYQDRPRIAEDFIAHKCAQETSVAFATRNYATSFGRDLLLNVLYSSDSSQNFRSPTMANGHDDSSVPALCNMILSHYMPLGFAYNNQ